MKPKKPDFLSEDEFAQLEEELQPLCDGWVNEWEKQWIWKTAGMPATLNNSAMNLSEINQAFIELLPEQLHPFGWEVIQQINQTKKEPMLTSVRSMLARLPSVFPLLSTTKNQHVNLYFPVSRNDLKSATILMFDVPLRSLDLQILPMYALYLTVLYPEVDVDYVLGIILKAVNESMSNLAMPFKISTIDPDRNEPIAHKVFISQN